MAVAWDGDGAVHERADEGPDEARDGLRPAAEQLQAERHAVDVGTVVRDDAEGQDDEAELAEAAEGWEEHGGEEPADAGLLVAVGVAGVDGVRDCRRDGQTEHFGETKRQDETAICPSKGLDPGDGHRLVYRVIGRVTRPACPEPIDRC